MKEKLTRNISLKVLSVILAALLWLVITNVDDPIETKSFRDVTVTILNEDLIESLGQTYDIIEGKMIDFTVSARRSVKDELEEGDFVVTADFAHLSDVHAVQINIDCPNYRDRVVVTDTSNHMMTIKLEDLIEKNFKVNIVQSGEPTEGYFVGEKTANPNIIRVSGPEGRVESIKEVVVNLDVSGISGPFRRSLKPVALDEDGKIVDSSKLTFSENYVDVNLLLYKTKTINLQIMTTGEPAYGYAKTDVEYEPKTILVAGEDEALKKINYLSVKESITGATENIAREINLQDILDEQDHGIVIVGDDKTAVINITIEKLETKDINIWPVDIEARNMPDDMKIDYNSVGPIVVKIMAPGKELANITRTSLKPYIDLADSNIGTYSVEIASDFINDNTTIINNPVVSFVLSQAG